MIYQIYSRSRREDIHSYLPKIESKYEVTEVQVSDLLGDTYSLYSVDIPNSDGLRELKSILSVPIKIHYGFVDSHFMIRDGYCIELSDYPCRSYYGLVV